ncbi:MAG TPA: glycosyltransferase family 2 protein [Gaiellaceae bacterium]|nr:glycosyltransferase family 2 protein [Gaiellaceae bacterium]
MELTPLRALGLAAALVFAIASLWVYRRGRIGNGDLILRLLVFVLPLLVVSLEPAVFGWFLDQLSFRRGGGGRILGAAVVAVAVLYAFSYLLATRQERTRRDLTRLIENLALNEFRATTDVDEFAEGVAVVIPAYNEEANIAHVLATLPEEVAGLRLHAIVVDDGSSDETMERARAAGAAAVHLPLNRGQGAALRTGYRLALATGARLVVTMDADGQHQPSELPLLIEPILGGEADVVNGSRVLGASDRNHAARELGIKVFAWALSLLTASRVTDPACGYRAVRTEALRGLEFRQDQFHNSEFILEASKRKLRTLEVPVTVSTRLSGASKKPPHFRYGLGFANALLRAWLR